MRCAAELELTQQGSCDSINKDCLTCCTLSTVLKIMKIFMKGLLRHRALGEYLEAKRLHMETVGCILFQMYLQSDVLLSCFCI